MMTDTETAPKAEQPGRPQCPPWCVADRESQWHDDDRWHEGTVAMVPVVELRTVRRAEGFRQELVGAEMAVVLQQRVEQTEVFVLFGFGEERERNFRLSGESVRRLMDSLGAATNAKGTA